MYDHYKLIHISDIHFKTEIANSGESVRMRNRLRNLAEFTKKENPDFIIISGDFFHGTDYSAEDELIGLLRQLADNTRNILLVPGNHDVVRSDGLSIEMRFEKYIKFANKLRGGNVNSTCLDWNSTDNFISLMGSDGIKTDGYIEFAKATSSIRIFMFNNYREYTESTKDNINIDSEVIGSLHSHRDKLRGIDPDKYIFNIAVTHNPPLAPRASSPEAKLIKNADVFLEALSDAGVGLLLHGDMHESQHIFASRALPSRWPLYSAGAGGIIPATSNPIFHLINIVLSNDDNCSEVELNSYQFMTDDKIDSDGQRSFVFALPIKDKLKTSKGTIHVFELPQNRTKCDNNLIKRILFKYKNKSLGKVYDATVKLIDESGHKYQMTPDIMFSFFYDSMFSIFNPQTSIFRAVHNGNYKIWTEDNACRQILDSHDQKYIQLPHSSIERLIILKDKECQDVVNGKDDFEYFVKAMAAYKFPIYLSTRKVLTEYFETFEGVLKDRANDFSALGRISVGNIALVAEAGNIPSANEKNAVVFYYQDTNNVDNAVVSRSQQGVKFIKLCMKYLWERVDSTFVKDGNHIKYMYSCKELMRAEIKEIFYQHFL